jgi:hypothetical protein
MSNAGKRTLSFAAALICIILYAAAMIYGAGRIYINYSGRTVLAENEFNEILDRASGAAVLGFMSSAYQEVIQDTIRDSVTLLGVIISGSNGEFSFERQNGSVIESVGNSLRFKTGFGIAKDPLFRGIWIEGQRNTTVRAIYSYIDYNLFIQVLKDTLFIILLIVAFAVFVLILEINIKARWQSQTVPVPEYRQAQPDIPSPAVQRPAPEIKREEGTPKGLYSPRGIGWESYTAERLESELHRCATLEEDLVLIEMESGRSRFGEETYKKLIIEVVRFFTQRDLIFEKGEQGITLIIPALTLEQGFSKSEEFRNKINNNLIDSSGADLELCMGLSSRAGRLVEADRLIFEASQALVKAVNDPDSPIVAFKSDPEKYRDFISKRKKS